MWGYFRIGYWRFVEVCCFDWFVKSLMWNYIVIWMEYGMNEKGFVIMWRMMFYGFGVMIVLFWFECMLCGEFIFGWEGVVFLRFVCFYIFGVINYYCWFLIDEGFDYMLFFIYELFKYYWENFFVFLNLFYICGWISGYEYFYNWLMGMNIKIMLGMIMNLILMD